jgi:hypothetical protein
MSDSGAPQPAPVIGFLHPQGNAVLIGELDSNFLEKNSLGPTSWERPLRVETEPKLSKKGNTFFDYQQVLPLPDGLDTHLTIDETPLQSDDIGESKRGNPTRKHAGIVTIAGTAYDVTAFITATKSGYWVKVHAHIASSSRSSSSAEKPKGGRFI